MVVTGKMNITPVEGTWVIRAGGAVLGETDRALQLDEEGHEPVIYFPRDDIGMDFLDPSDTTSHCPLKGDASYFSIVTKSGVIADAGWSYESPIEEARAIAGHIAFYPDKVTVEEV